MQLQSIGVSVTRLSPTPQIKVLLLSSTRRLALNFCFDFHNLKVPTNQAIPLTVVDQSMLGYFAIDGHLDCCFNLTDC